MGFGITGFTPQMGNASGDGQAQTLQNISQEIGELKNDLSNLTDELMAGQSTSGTKQEGTEGKTGARSASQATSQKVQDAKQQRVPEEALAVMTAEEEDKKVKKKRKKTSFDEKLEMLMDLEEVMMDAELENPEDQAMLEQFFQNMNRIRNLRGRLKQLEDLEQKYMKQLEDSEKNEQEKSVEKKPMSPDMLEETKKSVESSVPPHIQMSFQPPEELLQDKESYDDQESEDPEDGDGGSQQETT